MKTDFVGLVSRAAQEADRAGALLRPDTLSGYSGAKLIGLLQRLVRLFEGQAGVCYAEIGVFQGLTLLSVAAAAPKLSAFGIDNFSQFDPEHQNKQLVLDRQRRLSLSNVSLLDLDYEEALRRFEDLSGGKRIGVLFVDGPHDYRSQLLCVLLALPHLADDAVVVIDDCNYEHVRLSTRDLLLVDPSLKLVFQAYSSDHPANLGSDLKAQAEAGWWNGVHVLVRGPAASSAPTLMPSTGGARERCEREHLLQAHAADICSLELYDLAYDLAIQPGWRTLRRAWGLLRGFRNEVRKRRLHRNMNTYSSEIARRTAAADYDSRPSPFF